VERRTLITSKTSVLAAVAASSCCWLPLVLLAAGASASWIGGVTSTIEHARPAFAALAIGLLAVAAYFTYFRQPSAATSGENCCAVPAPEQAQRLECTCCGRPARRVPARTVRALVREDLRGSVMAADYGLCLNPACAQVYTAPAAGRGFVKSDLVVRVGYKEQQGPHLVCYCFDHSVEDVEDELRRTGSTTIPDRIAAEIKAGRCACDVKNPQGACCLGNVHEAVRQARARLAGGHAAPVGAPATQCSPSPAITEDHGACCGLPRSSARPAGSFARARRLNQVFLPFVAAAILAMVFFPHRVFALFTREGFVHAPSAPAAGQASLVLHMPGTT
jgi:hypothetical protein